MSWDTTKCKMPIWVVYCCPADYPHHYVVRLHDLTAPTAQHYLADTLEDARKALPKGLLCCFSAQVGDEPQIVESWL